MRGKQNDLRCGGCLRLTSAGSGECCSTASSTMLESALSGFTSPALTSSCLMAFWPSTTRVRALLVPLDSPSTVCSCMSAASLPAPQMRVPSAAILPCTFLLNPAALLYQSQRSTCARVLVKPSRARRNLLNAVGATSDG